MVRVSGPDALLSFALITKDSKSPQPRQALFRALYDPKTGSMIDRALVLPFKGPNSFTGEDVVEYHIHGSGAVLSALLGILNHCDNHRMAEHGEFTRRAFENGKMDLTEAEAIADLINAETQMQREQALLQMDGALSKLYEDWRTRLIKAMAYIETVIDFPDEDIPDSQVMTMLPTIEGLIHEIEDHLCDGHRGERLRDGIHIALIGAPNAGKSSLLNALAKRDIAIVSPMAGTTRDVVEAHLDLGGYPVIIADTAGLRPEEITEDGGHGSIESEGIRRALARAHAADIRLLLFDGTQDHLDANTLALLNERSVIVYTKSDLPDFKNLHGKSGHVCIELSSTTGSNIDALLSALTEKIAGIYTTSRDTPSLTRARHRSALEEALARLKEARHAPLPELMAEDVRMAARGLGRITGRVDVEDLLDVIFRDFCIGK